MPLWLPVAFFIATTLESLLLGSLLLWASCRWLKLPPASMRRVFATNLILILASVIAPAALAPVAIFAPVNDEVRAALGLAILPVLLIVQCAIIARLLHAGALKAFLAWLIATVPVVLVSFGLATMAKAALVEAFKIPTGAMGPTILGSHADCTCEHCGFAYAVGLSQREPPTGVSRAEWEAELKPLATFCPNCRQPDEIELEAPLAQGDRIMVEKQAMPQRWEIFVFRFPEDRSVNFIKRLVGLPGETIQIVAGEVFADGKWLQKAPTTAQDLWLHVHDTAFRATKPVADEPGWRPTGEASHWRQQDGRWTNGGDGESDSLVYFGPIDDRNAYNAQSLEIDLRRDDQTLEVGDVLVACDVAEFSGAGRLSLTWRFRSESAEIAVSPEGQVELQAVASGAGEQRRERASGKLAAPLRPGDRLGFAIRDGQAYLVHNDKVALLLPFGSPEIETFKARSQEPATPCQIALVADRCRVALSRIVLARDVYYRGGDKNDFFWSRMRGCLDRPTTLGETEYFSLGDNSAFSKDSRFYDDLQATDILGTARWIYWPKKRWHAFR